MIELIQNQQTPQAEETADPIIDKQLIEECLKFVETLDDCAGLSANQLMKDGYRINKRFFFAVKSADKHEFVTILNPVIHEYYGKTATTIEGCLSHGGDKKDGRRIYVSRYHGIRVTYMDMWGEKYTGEFEGFSSQVFQHCTDHLNGVKEKFMDETQENKQGRNEPCRCGSGLKYKKCHGSLN